MTSEFKGESNTRNANHGRPPSQALELALQEGQVRAQERQHKRAKREMRDFLQASVELLDADPAALWALCKLSALAEN